MTRHQTEQGKQYLQNCRAFRQRMAVVMSQQLRVLESNQWTKPQLPARDHEVQLLQQAIEAMRTPPWQRLLTAEERAELGLEESTEP